MRKLSHFLFLMFLTIFIFGVYHTINSSRGLLTIKKIEKEVENKILVLQEIRTKKTLLLMKIQMLQNQDINSDYVEELIKKNTSYVHKNEFVILLND